MNNMTQIKHHLTDQLLIGYAAGTLPEAFNLVVATHLSMCDSCRAATQAMTQLAARFWRLTLKHPWMRALWQRRWR